MIYYVVARKANPDMGRREWQIVAITLDRIRAYELSSDVDDVLIAIPGDTTGAWTPADGVPAGASQWSGVQIDRLTGEEKVIVTTRAYRDALRALADIPDTDTQVTVLRRKSVSVGAI
jgi:hypothetical protein